MKKSVLNLATGMLISLIVLFLGLISLELLVRKIKPQITLDQARILSPGDFQPSSFAPFTLRPNIRRGPYFINSLGYRSDEFTIQKPDNTYRILVLGDSFVSGMDPDNSTIWPQVLQRLLTPTTSKKVQIINAGFHDGYSPDSYYAYLKAEGLDLHPDLIIEGLYLQNDIGDLKPNDWPKVDDKGLPLQVVSQYRKIDGQGRQWDGLVPLRYRYPILSQSHLWILFAQWLDRHFPTLFHAKDEAEKVKQLNEWNDLNASECIYEPGCFSVFEPYFNKMLMVLGGTAQLLQSHRIPYLIIFEPSRYQVRTLGYILSDDQVYSLQNKVTTYFQQNSLSAQFLDLTPEMLKGDPWSYYNDQNYHWNAAGNQVAADLVFSKVVGMMPK